jgi:hypothetical protein
MVIPSEARDPHRPDRGPSIVRMRIPHFVRNDNSLYRVDGDSSPARALRALRSE